MEYRSSRKPVYDYIVIIIGTTLLAAAINMFFEPMELVTGGVTGLAIIVKDLTKNVVSDEGIPLYVTNLFINIPLFLIAIWIKGKDFGRRSLFSTIFLSFALYYTQWLPQLNVDTFLACIFGGVIAGVGLGLVFSAFSTTGGTDLCASIIQHYIKHISVAQLMLILDACIIIGGLFVFGIEKAMYAIIAVYISAKVIDTMLEGIHFSKAAFIISDKHDHIAKEIMATLDRGVTGLYGQGVYSLQEKKILLCVVSKKQIAKLKDIVRDLDKNAFVIVADVREVLGEGFIEYS